MFAWRGFTDDAAAASSTRCSLLAIVVAGTGVALRWWRIAGPAGGARPGRRRRLVVAMLLITGSPLPVGDGWTELHPPSATPSTAPQRYAAPVPAGAPPVDPLLIAVRAGLPAARRPARLHPAPGAAGRAAAARRSTASRSSMIGDGVTWWVFARDRGRLPRDAVPPAERPRRPLGPPARHDRETGDPIAFGAGANARPQHRRRDRRRRHRAGRLVLPALIPTLGLHVFDRPGPGGGDDIQRRQPDDRPGPRPASAARTSPLVHGDHRRPRPVVPADRCAHPLHRRRSGPRATGTCRPTSAPTACCRRRSGSSAGTCRRDEYPYDVTILPAFDSTWLPTQRADQPDRRRRRLALRPSTMDFLAGRRRPDHRRTCTTR